jgi:3-dehydroquinate dehydratase II
MTDTGTGAGGASARAGRRGASGNDVLVLNGPNLSRLGTREPDVYGAATFADLATLCRETGRRLGLHAVVRQTDDEAVLVRWLHEAADARIPVILNPAAFTHYSYALRDAAAQRTAPLIEVHISNPAAREEFRHNSVVAGVATGTVAGFGLMSYQLAMQAVAQLLAQEAARAAADTAAGEPGASGERAATGEREADTGPAAGDTDA